MSDIRTRGAQSQMIRIAIPDNSKTDGSLLGGLTNASTNLRISYLREFDSALTSYTGANIEAQTTIGTYEAPSSSSKCRFKETPIPGVYEIQVHNSATIFGTADASAKVQIYVAEDTTSALKIGPNAKEIQLTAFDLQSASVVPSSGTISAVTGGVTVSSGTISGGTINTITGNVIVTSGTISVVTGSVTVGSSTITTVTGSVGSVTAAVTLSSAYDAAKTAAPAATALSNATWTDAKAALLDSTLSVISGAVTNATFGNLATKTELDNMQALLTPVSQAAYVQTITYGSSISGSYANTDTIDSVYFTLAPVAVNGLDVTLGYLLGATRLPIDVSINGWWQGSGRYCNVYAWDFLNNAWNQLTNSTSRMNHRTNAANYLYPLTLQNVDPTTGEVRIRFYSPSVTTGDRLNIDKATVNNVEGATGGASGLTAEQVWAFSTRTLTSTGGESATPEDIAIAVRDVDNSAPASGSLGEKVNSAATGVDPWGTVLPGTYSDSMAGKIIGDTAAVADIAAAILAVPAYPILTDSDGYVTAHVDGEVTVSGTVSANIVSSDDIDFTAKQQAFLSTLSVSVSGGTVSVSVGEIADAVWDETLGDHLTPGTTGEKLSEVSTVGIGSSTFTYTLTSAITGLPIAGVTIWVTTDSAGLNAVASDLTDAFGVVDFRLDAGTYYLWRLLSGWTFSDPQTITVPGSDTGTGTPVAAPVPSTVSGVGLGFIPTS